MSNAPCAAADTAPKPAAGQPTAQGFYYTVAPPPAQQGPPVYNSGITQSIMNIWNGAKRDFGAYNANDAVPTPGYYAPMQPQQPQGGYYYPSPQQPMQQGGHYAPQTQQGGYYAPMQQRSPQPSATTMPTSYPSAQQAQHGQQAVSSSASV